MAIYRLSAQVIKRSAGRSVVAAASYRAAEKLKDHRLVQTFDFTRKAGVEHSEIMLPKGAPAWMADREQLWNAVEKAEKRKDSQLAREVQVSLPREMNLEQQVSLVRDFVQEQMTSRGMVADVCIHHDNPDTRHGRRRLHPSRQSRQHARSYSSHDASCGSRGLWQKAAFCL
jgi:ATP-dependent exoDNAse (exonuclease V) alpha subunit